MEHLVDLDWYFRQNAADQLGEKQLTNEHKREMKERLLRAKTALAKSSAIGGYAISSDAAAALAVLIGQIDRWPQESSLYDFFDKCHDSVESCIAKVRECAKADLKRR
jgi:hypothetical protein